MSKEQQQKGFEHLSPDWILETVEKMSADLVLNAEIVFAYEALINRVFTGADTEKAQALKQSIEAWRAELITEYTPGKPVDPNGIKTLKEYIASKQKN